MAFSYIGHRGSAWTKDAGTTLAATVVTANVAIGRLVLVRCVTDNVGTTGGATTGHAITDSRGNTYTRLLEYTRTAGSDNDGVTTSVHWAILTTALVADTDTVTLTTPSLAARLLAVDEFSLGAGNVVAMADYDYYLGTGTSYSLTVGDMTSREYLLVGVMGRENIADTYNQDNDYTAFDSGTVATSGGSGTTNISLYGGFRIATLTEDTYNGTRATADWAEMLVALYEDEGEEPESVTGTGALSAQPATIAATGTLKVTGTGAVAARAATIAATGTLTVRGLAAITAASALLAGTGTVEVIELPRRILVTLSASRTRAELED